MHYTLHYYNVILFQDIIATICTSVYIEGINHIIDNTEIKINFIQNTHM